MQVSYFLNKYNGKCITCGSKVIATDGICFQSNGKWACGCRGCFPAESAGLFAARDAKNAKAIAEMEAMEAARLVKIAERKALIEKLGICFDSPFDSKTTQGAWNDCTEWKVPFNGDGTDEEFSKAVYTPSESLYGRLRASNGQGLVAINREEGYIVLSESVSLCD
jgi:hypothetical protein